MLAIENIFGLGQDAPAAVPASVSPAPQTIVMPVIPDNTVVRCRFDTSDSKFHCSPVGMFEAPTVFLLAAAGVALLGLGYAFGRTRYLPRAVEKFTAEPRLP